MADDAMKRKLSDEGSSKPAAVAAAVAKTDAMEDAAAAPAEGKVAAEESPKAKYAKRRCFAVLPVLCSQRWV